MKTFEFSKSYEEFQVADKVYRVDMSDEKVKEYQNTFKAFAVENEKFNEIDIAELTDKQQEELFTKQINNMKKTTEVFLGEGTFDELYLLAGKSTLVYIELVHYLMEIFGEKTESLTEKARNKYIKKKK